MNKQSMPNLIMMTNVIMMMNDTIIGFMVNVLTVTLGYWLGNVVILIVIPYLKQWYRHHIKSD
jgi:hypothetical protein